MKTQCAQCSKTFTISDEDKEFYKRLQLPLPTRCPDCRCRRRMATRNERNFYPDQCDVCGKNLISLYSQDKSLTVYCHECWWSETWNAVDYGQDINFTRSFFEQFQELQRKVPRANVLKAGGTIENSDYCSYIGDAKNCYLIAGSVYVEDCLYGNPYYSKQCVDSLLIRDCELCYECITSEHLYNCAWCQDCFNSLDLLYCYDVKNSSDCIGCVGLRNAQYYIFNVQYSKEEYMREKANIDLCNPEKMQRLISRLNKLKLHVARNSMMGVHNEQVSGNYINDSTDCSYCFDIKRCEHVKYSAQVIDLKDCYDNNYTEENELCVDYIGSWKNTNCQYSNTIYNCTDVQYSELCYSSNNLFGCTGLRNAEYCILNKQYSKEKYNSLLPQLVEHMKVLKEYGEFFPIERSIFAYNEAVANDYFPETEQTIRNLGWQWFSISNTTKNKQHKQTYRVPREIQNVKPDICDAILQCIGCNQNYKIITQELDFYKQQGLPVPKYCPACRQQQRMAMRPQRELWQRQCMCTQPDHAHGTQQCDIEFSTAYSPNVKELVFCELCYQKEIY